MARIQENIPYPTEILDSVVRCSSSQAMSNGYSKTLDSIFSHFQSTPVISEPLGSSVYLRQRDLIQQFYQPSPPMEESPFIGPGFGPRKGKQYRGVRQRQWGKWVAEIRLPQNRMRVWLGTYDSAEAAAYAYDRAAYKLRREYSRLNFPNLRDPARLGLGDGRALDVLRSAVDAKIEAVWKKVRREKKARRAAKEESGGGVAGKMTESPPASAVNGESWSASVSEDGLFGGGDSPGSVSYGWCSAAGAGGVEVEGWSLARLPSYDPELIWEILAS